MLFATQNKYDIYCTCTNVIAFYRHRGAFAKSICGVAPLRIDTGRYAHIVL